MPKSGADSMVASEATDAEKNTTSLINSSAWAKILKLRDDFKMGHWTTDTVVTDALPAKKPSTETVVIERKLNEAESGLQAGKVTANRLQKIK
jgi:hypothetical protein